MIKDGKLIIGIPEGQDIKIPCCHTCLWMNAPIAQSNTFYTLREKTAGISIYVYKESPEGLAISKWLEECMYNDEDVYRKALELLLPRLDIDTFLHIIETHTNEAHKQGQKDSRKAMRTALGIGIDY